MLHTDTARVLVYSEINDLLTYEQFIRRNYMVDGVALAETLGEPYVTQEELDMKVPPIRNLEYHVKQERERRQNLFSKDENILLTLIIKDGLKEFKHEEKKEEEDKVEAPPVDRVAAMKEAMYDVGKACLFGR